MRVTNTRLQKSDLQSALEDADLRVLVVTLYQATADPRWLSDRYRPKRDRKIISDLDAGFSEDVQAEIRAAAAEILFDGDRPVAMPDPSDDQLAELMSFCLGEPVPPEYAPMMAEEVGFRSRHVAWPEGEPRPPLPKRPVVIVGAGASGLALGANLVKLGIPFVILEKNDDVGGTWLENRYPGCGVDTPNHAYSFSFGQRYPWSQCFSPRDEILDYIRRCADEFDVRPRIRFRTTVTATTWNEEGCFWSVTTESESGDVEVIEAFVLVSAIGILNLPVIPDFEGRDTFEGPSFHTARWPTDLDYRGKRMAVIGTGASAMQVVPSVAPDVEQLTIFQRTPQWARPIERFHDKIGANAQLLLDNVPLYGVWFRLAMFYRYSDALLPYLRKDPEWPHPERAVNRVNDRHRQQMLDHMIAELGDQADRLLPKCKPTYPPYGKRILLDNGWFKTLRRDNVELVTDGVRAIAPDGVVSSDGAFRPFDIIVYSTGFQVTLMAARLNVTGRHRRRLEAVWEGDNPTAYLGITVPGFPNMFSMLGPNTGLGHGGSAIFVSECQSRYISGCIVEMLRRNIDAIDVRAQSHDEYVERVDAEHERMIWTHPGMSPYYRNRKGRVFAVMPWRLVDYWRMTHEPDLSVYDLTFGSTAPTLAQAR